MGKVNPCTATAGQHGRYGAGSGRVSMMLHLDNCAKPLQRLWSVMFPPLCMVSWLLQGGAETPALEHVLSAPVFGWADCSSPCWLHGWAYAASIKLAKLQLVICLWLQVTNLHIQSEKVILIMHLSSTCRVVEWFEVAAWSFNTCLNKSWSSVYSSYCRMTLHPAECIVINFCEHSFSLSEKGLSLWVPFHDQCWCM